MNLITKELIQNLIFKAGNSPRRRMNLNFHKAPSDVVQKMLVATKIDTYFRPHKHINKNELALVIKGSYEILLFNDSGGVIQREKIGSGYENTGFEIEPGIFHTWIPLEDDSKFFEVKQGPFDPETASEFASWSPEEGSDKIADFIESLKKI